MKVGKVINLNKFNLIIEFFKKNYLSLILTLFYIFGLAFGIFSYKNSDSIMEYSTDYLLKFCELRTESGFLKILFNSLFSSVTYIAFLFIAGGAILGFVLVPFLISVKGFSLGCITAYIYSEYALKGVAFNAVMIMPWAVILVIAMILAGRESIKFSFKLTGLTIPTNRPANLFNVFKLYCGKYIFILFLCLLSAFADGLISYYFADSFIL